jgi:PIN domain nuclease of toxin-antitoxin system
MKLLLDTHTVLWIVIKPEKLSSQAKALLLNEENTLYISIVSTWEIAIKISLGKLSDLKDGVGIIFSKISEMPITLLPIMPRHVKKVETLPFIHRDPFDRLLIATAKADGLTIMTADENIHKYDVSFVW